MYLLKLSLSLYFMYLRVKSLLVRNYSITRRTIHLRALPDRVIFGLVLSCEFGPKVEENRGPLFSRTSD